MLSPPSVRPVWYSSSAAALVAFIGSFMRKVQRMYVQRAIQLVQRLVHG